MSDVVLKGCWLLAMVLASACSSQRYLNTQLHQAEEKFKDHIGFVLYDPTQHKTLYDHQGDRYFTPASNTKIFTFYTCLRVLGDSVPAFRYVLRNDSLIFWGTGDPGFLYADLPIPNRAFEFLKNQSSGLFFSSSNFYEERFGPGWAWDDYRYAFQVERTPFPVYGNQVKITVQGDSIQTTPALFRKNISISSLIKAKRELGRDVQSNAFTYFPDTLTHTKEWNIPFQFSDELLTKLLSDTLKKKVTSITIPFATSSKTLFAAPADSLYKVMMQQSDNFIAEQLLLLCSNTLGDSLRSEIAINYSKKQLLSDLPDEPKWMDGSGLSRYNLFTPRSIVALWEKIYVMMPRERLLNMLAVGGRSGTLKNSYRADKPYIYGKTGTLSNNHCLSGFLVTKRGRTLIFSWMNNNFTGPASEIRAYMETTLKWIYEKY